MEKISLKQEINPRPAVQKHKKNNSWKVGD
jgi:hypothetical protein